MTKYKKITTRIQALTCLTIRIHRSKCKKMKGPLEALKGAFLEMHDSILTVL